MEEDNFELETRDSIMGTYQSMTGKIFFAAICIAGISLLIGGIGIMNIMLVSVRERTREIGIRKALGARRGDILWQFLVEAMTLSIAGGMLGLGLAVGGLKLAARYTDKLPMEISTTAVITAVVFSMVVGIFFGVFPARKAAALDPIESLRYE
jgi:putative ABC transport system permease protein